MKKTIRGVTYDTAKATPLCGVYRGRGPWDGPLETLCRTVGNHYFLHRRWSLIDGRRMKSDETPWQIMGRKRDFDRLTQQHEVQPISRVQALLLCLELRIPKDLRPELRKLIRTGTTLPKFRASRD